MLLRRFLVTMKRRHLPRQAQDTQQNFVLRACRVSTSQMEWLAEQLEAAKAAEQKVIVFVHYRLDGGPGGPVNCSASTGKETPLFCAILY